MVQAHTPASCVGVIDLVACSVLLVNLASVPTTFVFCCAATAQSPDT